MGVISNGRNPKWRNPNVEHGRNPNDKYLRDVEHGRNPIQHKQSVVNTLLERAKKLSSTAQEWNNELKLCEMNSLVEWLPEMDD